MKFIQKHPLPGQGGCSSLNLQPGSKIVHIGLEGEQAYAYFDGPCSYSAPVYWVVEIVREGQSYGDNTEVMGSFDDPMMPPNSGNRLFVVGRING